MINQMFQKKENLVKNTKKEQVYITKSKAKRLPHPLVNGEIRVEIFNSESNRIKKPIHKSAQGSLLQKMMRQLIVAMSCVSSVVAPNIEAVQTMHNELPVPYYKSYENRLFSYDQAMKDSILNLISQAQSKNGISEKYNQEMEETINRSFEVIYASVTDIE